MDHLATGVIQLLGELASGLTAVDDQDGALGQRFPPAIGRRHVVPHQDQAADVVAPPAYVPRARTTTCFAATSSRPRAPELRG
jgi:hypothetical protein